MDLSKKTVSLNRQGREIGCRCQRSQQEADRHGDAGEEQAQPAGAKDALGFKYADTRFRLARPVVASNNRVPLTASGIAEMLEGEPLPWPPSA